MTNPTNTKGVHDAKLAEYRRKISAVLNWAETKESFDTSFVNSLSETVDRYGELTWNQERALDKIIRSFNIDVDEHADD